MSENPFDGLYYVEVPRPIYQDVDAVIEAGKHTSPTGQVETEQDWDVLISLYKLWRKYYPNHYQAFKQHLEIYRELNREDLGIKKDKGGGMIQHRLEIPERFHEMLTAFFPNIKYDRKFIKTLLYKLPEFRVSDDNL
jgi:hypothetical protein